MRIADCYRLLEIDEDCSDRELKSAFWRKAKELHPDKNESSTSSEEKFKQLTYAYERILSSRAKGGKSDNSADKGPEVRRKRTTRMYSEPIKTERNRNYRPFDHIRKAGFHDFEDLFDSFFDHLARGSRWSGTRRANPANNNRKGTRRVNWPLYDRTKHPGRKGPSSQFCTHKVRQDDICLKCK